MKMNGLYIKSLAALIFYFCISICQIKLAAQNKPELVMNNATFIDFSGGKDLNYRCVTIGDKGYIFLNNYTMLLETGGTSKNTRLLKSYNSYGGFINMVATNKYLYLLYKSDGYYYVTRIDPATDKASDPIDRMGYPLRIKEKYPNTRKETFPNIIAYADRVCVLNYIFDWEKPTRAVAESYFVHDVDESPKVYNGMHATTDDISFMYATPGTKFNMAGDMGVYYRSNDAKLYTFQYTNAIITQVKEKMYSSVKNYDVERQQQKVVKITTIADKNICVIADFTDPAKQDSTLLFELSNRMNFVSFLPKGTDYLEGNTEYLYLQSNNGIYELNRKTNELITLFTINKNEVFGEIQTQGKKLLIENGKVYFATGKSGSNTKEYKAYDLSSGNTYVLGYASSSPAAEKEWLHVIGDYYYYLRKRPANEYEIINYYDLVKLKYKTGEEEIVPMPLSRKETYWGILDFVQLGNSLLLNVKYSIKGTAEKRVLTFKP